MDVEGLACLLPPLTAKRFRQFKFARASHFFLVRICSFQLFQTKEPWEALIDYDKPNIRSKNTKTNIY
jgi:hypothetical protein